MECSEKAKKRSLTDAGERCGVREESRTTKRLVPITGRIHTTRRRQALGSMTGWVKNGLKPAEGRILFAKTVKTDILYKIFEKLTEER